LKKLNEINKLLEFQVRILKILWIIELRYTRIVYLRSYSFSIWKHWTL